MYKKTIVIYDSAEAGYRDYSQYENDYYKIVTVKNEKDLKKYKKVYFICIYQDFHHILKLGNIANFDGIALPYEPDVAEAIFFEKNHLEYFSLPNFIEREIAEGTVTMFTNCAKRALVLSKKRNKLTWKIKAWKKILQQQEKTYGIIGFGEISRCVAKKINSLGLQVIVYSSNISCSEAECFNIKKVEKLEDIFLTCDYISMHESDKNIIADEVVDKFDMIRENATFVLTVTDVINEQILAEKLALRDDVILGLLQRNSTSDYGKILNKLKNSVIVNSKEILTGKNKIHFIEEAVAKIMGNG